MAATEHQEQVTLFRWVALVQAGHPELALLLILSRRIGESLSIGEDIEITVLEIRGNQVRLGVDAPENIAILREELHEVRDNCLEDVV